MYQPAKSSAAGGAFPWPHDVVVESAVDGLALALGERVRNAHPAARDFSMRDLSAILGARASKGTYSVSDTRAVSFGMGTSDFATLLAAGATPTVKRKYRAAARHLAFCGTVTVRDLRPYDLPRVDSELDLQVVSELGRVVGGMIATEGGAVAVRLTRYARALHITRRTIVNDETDLLAAIIAGVGPTVARKESALVAAALEAPADLDDGDPVFGLANTVADALDATSLAAAAAALMNQALPSGGKADNDLRHLVVAPDVYLPACKLIQEHGLAERVTVSPLVGLAAGRWFALADPDLSPTIAVVRMERSTEPVRVEPHVKPEGSDGAALMASAELGAGLLGRIGIVRGGA